PSIPDTTNPIDNNSDNNTSSNTQTPPPIQKNDHPLFHAFHVGFGDSGSFGFRGVTQEVVWLSSIDLILDDNIEQNAYYQDILHFDASQFDYLQSKLKNSKFVVYWVTQYWQENWLDEAQIQKAMDQGYVPVFNYWYFADELAGGLPSSEKIDAYYQHNIKFANFLKKLNGTKLVIMEPEFNKDVVMDSTQNQKSFVTIISQAIDNIKANSDEVLFSLCMTDTGNRGVNETYEKCGYEHCALGDKEEWSKTQYIYNALINKLDFISFKQMIGQFSRNHDNPGAYKAPNPKAYTNEELGIEYLAARMSNMTQFLHEKYHLPVFIPYIAIATATWSDNNQNSTVEYNELDLDGWEVEASSVYASLMQKKEELSKNGLFGFAIMSLFDNPQNVINGYQYFNFNEYHLGAIKTSAIDEVDLYRLGDIDFKRDIIDLVFLTQ
ncbi:MAG: hypothetical protein JXQ76_12385, partial [Campylobacterales bacterium]|nr:hypothetical protein [Campylobacterales bacterium]